MAASTTLSDSSEINKINENNENVREFEPNMNVVPGFASFEEFTTAGFKALVAATKCSNHLPQGQVRDVYESYPSFHGIMAKEADNVLAKIFQLMKRAGMRGNIQRRDDEEKFEMVVEANDCILEKVGVVLDEVAGVRSNPEPELVAKTSGPLSGAWNKNAMSAQSSSQVLNTLWNASKGLEKPQLKFKDKIDNSRENPFEPIITFKHNLLKPLAILLEEDESGLRQFSHPYEFELERFQPPAEQLRDKSPRMYKPLDKTPLNLITNVQGLQLMLQDLKNYTEIALDLEHHSYRTFQGITCLMQVSTRNTDYVVDTLALRGELHVLNEVLTNPKVVKVLHGADSDVRWLQRDLGLYLVNMFDTYHAARTLHYPHLSLAFLLSRFCEVEAQKHFQLADWRIRPLPEELILYAREDTHYLLYIYDMLKKALLEAANGQTNLLTSVIAESTRTCLIRYVKPQWDEDSYRNLYQRSRRLFDNRQQFALKHLHEWCDIMARQQDESTGYVLPMHMMLQIAETLPREVQGILACCNPIPPLVRQHVTALHSIILKAREQPLVKPVFAESQLALRELGGTGSSAVESPLRCPHDLTREPDFRDDLPTLLGRDVRPVRRPELRSTQAVVSALGGCAGVRRDAAGDQVTHLTPYQRYKLVKPFADAQEESAAQAADAVSSNKQKILQMEISTLQSKLKRDEQVMVLGEVKDEPVETNTLSTMVRAEKRKSGGHPEGSEKVKRVKTEPKQPNLEEINSKKLIANPLYEDPSERTETIKKQKKKGLKKNEESRKFQPFDYSAVNFNKFKTKDHGQNRSERQRKGQKKGKNSKKAGKKKFKISI